MNIRLEGYSTELELLLGCLKTAINGSQRQTGEQVDWDRFLQLVIWHRVVPLVYQSPQRNIPGAIPDKILQKLASLNARNIRKSLALTRELGRLVNLFEKNGIQVLTFKGPALSQGFYGDLGARHAGDIDLLIEPENVARAHELIQEAGYRFNSSDVPFTSKQFRTFLQLREEFIYEHKTGPFKVDIHWRLIATKGFFPLEFSEIARNASDFEIGSTTVKTLSLDHTILYLFVHGAVHSWFRLKWLCDIAQVLHQNASVEWPSLLTRADDLGVKRVVLQGSILANSLLDVPLPEIVIREAAEDRRLHSLLKRALFAISQTEDISSQNGFALFKKTFYRLNLKKNLVSKLTVLFWRLRTSPDDWRFLPLPDKLFHLYYLLRPFFLIIALFKKGYFYVNPTQLHNAQKT